MSVVVTATGFWFIVALLVRFPLAEFGKFEVGLVVFAVLVAETVFPFVHAVMILASVRSVVLGLIRAVAVVIGARSVIPAASAVALVWVGGMVALVTALAISVGLTFSRSLSLRAGRDYKSTRRSLD
jgi:hypothetical protein